MRRHRQWNALIAQQNDKSPNSSEKRKALNKTKVNAEGVEVTTNNEAAAMRRHRKFRDKEAAGYNGTNINQIKLNRKSI